MPVDAEIIRPAGPADVPLLSDLFLEVFGQRRSPEVWRWKLFENPRGAASYVCESAGRLVAHCAGLPVRFTDYGTEYAALQSVDFMSSPHYAGGIGRGGVFVRTAEAFFRAHCGPDAVPLVYGFPGERHRLLGERILGYRSIERVGELTLDPIGAGEGWEPLDERHLMALTHVPMQLGAVRDEAYLRWRYAAHPEHRYGYIEVRRRLRLHSRLSAIVRDAGEFIYLMELGGSFSRPTFEALVRILSGLGKPVVWWGSPLHPVGMLLESCGFRATLREHAIECRFFINHDVPRPGELYYTLGDYDVY